MSRGLRMLRTTLDVGIARQPRECLRGPSGFERGRVRFPLEPVQARHQSTTPISGAVAPLMTTQQFLYPARPIPIAHAHAIEDLVEDADGHCGAGARVLRGREHVISRHPAHELPRRLATRMTKADEYRGCAHRRSVRLQDGCK